MAFRGRLQDSIQTRVFLCIAATGVVLVAAVAALVYGRASAIIKQDAANYVTYSLESLTAQVGQVRESTANTLLQISINEDVTAKLAEKYGKASYEAFAQFNDIVGIMDNAGANESHIERLAVVEPDGTSFWTGEPMLLEKEALALKDALADTKPNTFLYEDGEIWCWRPIAATPEGTAIAAAEISAEHLEEIFSNISIPGASVFAVDSRMNILAGSAPEGAPEALGGVWDEVWEGGGAALTRPEGGEETFVAVSDMEEAGLHIFLMVPYQSMISGSVEVFNIALFGVAAAIALAVLISWILSRMTTRDMKTLRVSMLKISQGEMLTRAEIPSESELADLALIFNSMMDKIDSLIKETTRSEVERQRLQQDYLNAQIRPHFIYNTLNTLKYLALERGQDDLARAITCTVELLRAAIGKNTDKATLAEEANYARMYVDLHNFRNKMEISFSEEIEGLEDVPVPILILQPLVENACLHGMEGRNKGAITVKAESCGGRVRVSVIDDGAGFDAESMERDKLYGVGVSNVLERMKLVHGGAFSFRISSSRAAGTVVALEFPCPGK